MESPSFDIVAERILRSYREVLELQAQSGLSQDQFLKAVSYHTSGWEWYQSPISHINRFEYDIETGLGRNSEGLRFKLSHQQQLFFNPLYQQKGKPVNNSKLIASLTSEGGTSPSLGHFRVLVSIIRNQIGDNHSRLEGARTGMFRYINTFSSKPGRKADSYIFTP